MQRDSTQRHVKSLDVVLGADTSVLILDDTEGVWPAHAANLIQVDRYIFFPACVTRFGRSHKSLLEAGKDDNVETGMLSTALRVMQQVHRTLFQVILCYVHVCRHGLVVLHGPPRYIHAQSCISKRHYPRKRCLVHRHHVHVSHCFTCTFVAHLAAYHESYIPLLVHAAVEHAINRAMRVLWSRCQGPIGYFPSYCALVSASRANHTPKSAPLPPGGRP